MKKAIALICCTMMICVGSIWGSTMMAQEEDAFSSGAVLPEDHLFTTMDEDGRLMIMDTETMEQQTAQRNADAGRQRMGSVGSMRAITHGVVNFRTKNSASLNTSYTEAGTGYSGYTNGYYAADAAFLGYEGTKVKFMLAGVVGLVNASEVEVLDADGSDTLYVSFYRCEQGMLRHYIKNDVYGNSYTAAVTVGEQQSYMKNDQVYYSYDGHYFYTDYNTMLDDYKAQTRARAINPGDPYYNYYQFVSNRTKTSFTAQDINSYVRNYLGSRYSASGTKLYEMGRYFIQYQNQYGANALSLFGVSANESAFGTSSIAMSKNNLFGHNAVDADPGLANGYSSPQNSIADHARYYVNLWYSTPKYSTYHGSFLGDKSAGMLSYASDPYWGEKAAHWAWKLDEYISGKSDVGRETLVMKEQGAVNIRKEPSTSSDVLYTTPLNGNMTFVLLDEVKGTVVSGSDVWYKIQLDTPLNASRSAVDYSGSGYDFAKSYGYIHSSLLAKITNELEDEDNSGSAGNAPENTITYTRGDVNDDGRITPADYVLVKNHIMGSKTLTGNALKAADMNNDGKVTPADYVQIKNKIMKN